MAVAIIFGAVVLVLIFPYVLNLAFSIGAFFLDGLKDAFLDWKCAWVDFIDDYFRKG